MRVNAVAPGWGVTDMTAEALEEVGGLPEPIPLGRVAEPDDVAGPVLFLCSEMAKYVTGVAPAHGGSGDPSPVTAYVSSPSLKLPSCLLRKMANWSKNFEISLAIDPKVRILFRLGPTGISLSVL